MERKTESPEELKLRIATARHEMTQVGIFDYVVVNREHCQDDTVDAIISIITAEHHRVKQRVVTL
jgi:guanylate kinase